MLRIAPNYLTRFSSLPRSFVINWRMFSCEQCKEPVRQFSKLWLVDLDSQLMDCDNPQISPRHTLYIYYPISPKASKVKVLAEGTWKGTFAEGSIEFPRVHAPRDPDIVHMTHTAMICDDIILISWWCIWFSFLVLPSSGWFLFPWASLFALSRLCI